MKHCLLAIIIILAARYSYASEAETCKRYLPLYPINFNFNNSIDILETWMKRNNKWLTGCDRFLSTEDNNDILLQVNIDFFNYKSFEVISLDQAEYILNRTSATHIIKIAHTIVAGDLVLMPVVLDLKTMKVDTESPFKRVTILEEGALSLLNYGSLNNILSNLMRLMLPNSIAIGPALKYMRNHRLLRDEIDVEVVDGNTQLWPSVLIDLNKIYPPFAFRKRGAFVYNMGSYFRFSRSTEIYEYKDNDQKGEYKLELLKLNINFFTELSYISSIGTLYSNLGFGWNLVRINDNLDRSEYNDLISLTFNLGYRYFFNEDVFMELEAGYSHYLPNLVSTPYVYVNDEIFAMLGVGLFVPGIYQGFFRLIR